MNTHAHLDHIGAIKKLKSYGNYPFYLHEKELELLNSANQYTSMFGMPEIDIPSVDYKWDSDNHIDFQDTQVRVIETPGHTQGGVSILIENHLFTGDTLFKGSIGRTDLPGGDMNTLLNSINNKIFILDENIIIHSGHGEDSTIGTEKKSNPFFNHG